MSEIGFFMMPEEASYTLTEAMRSCGLNPFVSKKVNGKYELNSLPRLDPSSRDDLERYLLKSEVAILVNELRPFIQVWMPWLDRNELRMGTISIGKNRHESLAGVYRENLKGYLRIKKNIMGALDMGLLGINTKTDGRHIYKDIGIDKNLSLLDIRLVPVQGGGNVEFRRP